MDLEQVTPEEAREFGLLATGDADALRRLIGELRQQLDAATGLLRTWIADYDNESWPYPARATREFLEMPPVETDF